MLTCYKIQLIGCALGCPMQQRTVLHTDTPNGKWRPRTFKFCNSEENVVGLCSSFIFVG